MTDSQQLCELLENSFTSKKRLVRNRLTHLANYTFDLEIEKLDTILISSCSTAPMKLVGNKSNRLAILINVHYLKPVQ